MIPGIKNIALDPHGPKRDCLEIMACDSKLPGSNCKEGEAQALNVAFHICQFNCGLILDSEEYLVAKYEAFLSME